MILASIESGSQKLSHSKKGKATKKIKPIFRIEKVDRSLKMESSQKSEKENLSINCRSILLSNVSSVKDNQEKLPISIEPKKPNSERKQTLTSSSSFGMTYSLRRKSFRRFDDNDQPPVSGKSIIEFHRLKAAQKYPKNRIVVSSETAQAAIPKIEDRKVIEFISPTAMWCPDMIPFADVDLYLEKCNFKFRQQLNTVSPQDPLFE